MYFVSPGQRGEVILVGECLRVGVDDHQLRRGGIVAPEAAPGVISLVAALGLRDPVDRYAYIFGQVVRGVIHARAVGVVGVFYPRPVLRSVRAFFAWNAFVSLDFAPCVLRHIGRVGLREVGVLAYVVARCLSDCKSAGGRGEGATPVVGILDMEIGGFPVRAVGSRYALRTVSTLQSLEPRPRVFRRVVAVRLGVICVSSYVVRGCLRHLRGSRVLDRGVLYMEIRGLPLHFRGGGRPWSGCLAAHKHHFRIPDGVARRLAVFPHIKQHGLGGDGLVGGEGDVWLFPGERKAAAPRCFAVGIVQERRELGRGSGKYVYRAHRHGEPVTRLHLKRTVELIDDIGRVRGCRLCPGSFGVLEQIGGV